MNRRKLVYSLWKGRKVRAGEKRRWKFSKPEDLREEQMAEPT